MSTTARPAWATETIPTHPDDTPQALGPAIITDNLTIQLDWMADAGPGIAIEDTSTRGATFGIRLNPTQALELAEALVQLLAISDEFKE